MDGCSSAAALLNDELLDLLDREGASNEMMECWAQKDASLPRPDPCSLKTSKGDIAGGNAIRPGDREGYLREVCLVYMQHIAHRVGMPMGSWFNAVLFFDLYTLRTGKMEQPQQLPLVCTAIVHAIRKIECARPWRSSDLLTSNHLAAWLRQHGYADAGEASPGELVEQEADLLKVLDGDLQLPSVYQWTTLLIRRLSALLRHKLSDSFDYMAPTVHRAAREIVLRRHSLGEFLPRRLATGLVCIGLTAYLIPPECICPGEVDASAWRLLLQQGGWPIGDAGNHLVPQQYRGKILETVKLATARSLEELRSDAYAVAVMMQGLFAERREAAAATAEAAGISGVATHVAQPVLPSSQDAKEQGWKQCGAITATA